jgi:hypothetical protein
MLPENLLVIYLTFYTLKYVSENTDKIVFFSYGKL